MKKALSLALILMLVMGTLAIGASAATTTIFNGTPTMPNPEGGADLEPWWGALGLEAEKTYHFEYTLGDKDINSWLYGQLFQSWGTADFTMSNFKVTIDGIDYAYTPVAEDPNFWSENEANVVTASATGVNFKITAGANFGMSYDGLNAVYSDAKGLAKTEEITTDDGPATVTKRNIPVGAVLSFDLTFASKADDFNACMKSYDGWAIASSKVVVTTEETAPAGDNNNTDNNDDKKPSTADAGVIALALTSLTSLAGGVIISKKRK